MIVPTQRAVMLVAAAAPAALLLGVLRPGGWLIAVAWVLGVCALVAIDGLMARRIAATDLALHAPSPVEVGRQVDLTPPDRAFAYAAEATDPLVPADPPLAFTAARRGTAHVARIWARVAGPLGLAWRQRSAARDDEILVVPDLGPVREQGMKQFLRSRQFGARVRPESGDGTEFQSLTDFQSGMERRAIDWKASARHFGLLAREYRTERDNSIVFAVDCGRAMCEPVDGVPRIDRAVSAALLAAFVALKSGDNVRLFAFAGRPSADSGSLSGARSFATLHRTAGGIDYCQDESNYTLSLTELDQRLRRRSLIVLFTEFTDPTSAELMLAAAARMLRRHRLLFVLFRDAETEAMIDARPSAGEDVFRSNVAAALLRERRIVIERLRRLGIEVVESSPGDMGLALAEYYVRSRERP
ncbi:DUF58 domain-containing protein [Sphingomonas sp.]|uniref:DUF58 domain-containing protein n=1 Tax=Sphingomonas sp. TaxID=28214 RepID=UPI001EC03399|nr:DUF58 domain-containing protein [Sphingomonas sp.]MBX3594178.1 DUF58 domain-containing protein [Sphingomonas sp.]